MLNLARTATFHDANILLIDSGLFAKRGSGPSVSPRLLETCHVPAASDRGLR